MLVRQEHFSEMLCLEYASSIETNLTKEASTIHKQDRFLSLVKYEPQIH